MRRNQDFEGKILLARSDLERAIDRLNWSRRMNKKGYIPAAVVTSDGSRKISGARPDATRVRLRSVQEITPVPRTCAELEGAVKGPRRCSNIKTCVSTAS